MSLDELRERIKNELVLHEGNIADWQWNRTGLPTEARELGITDFLRLVDDVARPLNAQFSKILELQAVIRKIAVDTQKRLSDVQIGGFALEAERLGLSRSFVTEQWVPRILAQLPDAEPTPQPAQPVAPAQPIPPPAPPIPPAPDAAEAMRQKVRHSLDDYKEHIPAAVIRTLFRTIDYDEAKLAEAVLAYLRDNFYASETEPTGPTLRDKLTSTDWRHLVWWENKPTQPTVAPTTPLPTPPPPVATVPKPAPSTGLRDMLFALLIAGGLIGFVIFLIKSGKSSPNDNQTTTDQVDTVARSERTQPTEGISRRKKKRRTTSTTPPASPDARSNESARATTSPRDQPYDELLNDVGQYGERPAKKDGQWGLWRKGRWMVLPVYDAIEVYNDGRARVSINGNSYDIDRNGDRIRE
ncbi:WG repeat-containing protein [Fibrella aestuarina]|nr:WG repeat-containing protein [Fibrella aestuarina]